MPRVTGDNIQTGYDATKHLIEHGHKHIGVIYGVFNVSSTNDRLEGYKTALKENNISFQENFLELGHATVAGGATAVDNLLKRDPTITALFIQNDLMTIGVISQLKKLGISIPNQIALIGFGDFASASIIDPPITTIVQPSQRLGMLAFDTLMQRINHSGSIENHCLSASLIRRKSCGCH